MTFHFFFSERAEQHEVVFVIGKPRRHVRMLGERKDLRNSFFPRAVQELVGCGNRVQSADSAMWGNALRHWWSVYCNRLHQLVQVQRRIFERNELRPDYPRII